MKRKRRLYQSIEPFPSYIDRNLFGAYLSGFVDGEGCFSLSLKRDSRKGSTIVNPGASFKMDLRSDDISVLRLFQSYFQCGWISVDKSGDGRVAGFGMSKLEHLVKILIPHFDRYPLFAKKKKDFAIWREAVEFMYPITKRRRVRWGRGFAKRWTKAEEAAFLVFKNRLHAIRRFEQDESLVEEEEIRQEILLFDEAI